MVESDDDEPEYYNKTKSFFDNISCEAVDRAEGYALYDLVFITAQCFQTIGVLRWILNTNCR